jgi:hypothetical protein
MDPHIYAYDLFTILLDREENIFIGWFRIFKITIFFQLKCAVEEILKRNVELISYINQSEQFQSTT